MLEIKAGLCGELVQLATADMVISEIGLPRLAIMTRLVVRAIVCRCNDVDCTAR